MDTLLSEAQRVRFLEAAFSRYKCYYVWPDKSNSFSGKDLKIAKYPRTYDCSGLVTCSLYDATDGKIDRRADWNCQRLMKNCMKVQIPEPGDLCFYGTSMQALTHVMIYIGGTKKRPDEIPMTMTVYGSSGGNSRTLSPDIAKQMNAFVKAHKLHTYRPDFRAFGRLVTNDK